MKSVDYRSRLVVFRMPLLLFGVTTIFAVGCSSSSSEDDPLLNNGGGNTLTFVTLIEAGSEPLRSLSVMSSADRFYSAVANAEEAVDFENIPSTDSVSASYDVSAEMTLLEDVVSLQLTPVLKSYSVAPNEFPATIDGRWNFTYTKFGELIDSVNTDSTGIARHNTLGVFMMPELILAVPDAEVGEGAIWTYQSAEPEGVVTNTVTVAQINDSIVKIDLQATILPSDVLASSGYSVTATTSYDTNTLLLIETELIRESSFEGEVSVNGQAGTLTSVVQNNFVVSEATP
ncbi:hypothetical protein [Granulosicoccus antarcticus]|uniref:Uncharacterized protein n=1 Tax=Granulosicoccus antarcticus IMCC3135 TaxID=1192854 RepID=A0A2Z2NW88_9GAMM|nr:hypothetical protein [Granulosicoccus antarcticus]ASJ74775.1 hypothetical protein IMCC3135_23530 [Granulosicoccus antarcticus IMCC3135]